MSLNWLTKQSLLNYFPHFFSFLFLTHTLYNRFLIENGASLSILSVDLELPIDVAQDEEMINLLTDSMKKQNIDGDAIKHSEEQMLLHDAQHWLSSGQYK